jgi:hypothetical protein
MRRARTAILVVMALVASTFAAWPTAAHAVGVQQPTLVNAVPQAATPDINNGVVYAIAQVGTQMIVGGTFTSASPHATPGTTYTHNYILSFNATTGAIDNTGFLPTLNGQVNAIIPGPAANEVYVGGSFSTVNGVTTHVALLSTTTGAIVSGWKAPATNGIVQTLALAGGRLFVGGLFTTAGGISHGGLIALNPTTGALTTYVSLAFTGHHNYGVNCDPTTSSCSNGGVGVRKIDVDPAGTHLIALGNFNSAGPVGGTASARDQVAMIDLGPTAAVVDPNWATDAYTAQCFSGAYDDYVRGVQFSPDGSYFVIVATGGSGTNSDGTNSSCDTVARYETNGTGSDVRPTWIDYTGQDSLLSVAVTASVVYVGGHERWLNNSQGYDYAGPGAVPRPGIAALSPVSGVPFSWNPGRNPRGAGAYSLLATQTGLWVGSDTDFIGNTQYKHGKIAYFPLTGGETVPADTTSALPGRVYTAGAFQPAANSDVLYRVNAGGPTVAAVDNGPDWQGDTTDPSPYRNSTSNPAGWSPGAAVDTTVPSTTPNAIFNSERWGPSHWAFPVPAGERVDVRLYFANRCGCTSAAGQRVFDVSIDGQSFLPGFDIVNAVGDQKGTMRDEVVTSDGEVDIDLTSEVENPLINGIEIVKVAPPATFPTPIYRVNAGGEKIAAIDGAAADWQADNATTVGTGTPFRTGQANSAFYSEDPWAGSVDATVDPSVVPTDVFGTESWDPDTTDTSGMHYSFPVAAGTPVNLKLYFANNYGGTSAVGQRVFSVLVDGQAVPALTNFDIVAATGATATGTERTVSVVAPASGLVTLDFTHSADNPLINAIEVDQTGASPTPPAFNVDQLNYRHFDGTTAGAEQSLSTGIAWGSIRGAFSVNGEVIYGKTDGNLYERSFDGSTFGSEVALQPWNDAYWDNVQTGSGQTYQGTESGFGAEIPSVTSMFFTNGRLYYTIAGDPSMHWRWFEPESGIVGSDEFTVSDGNDWSHVAGAFVSANTLYFADKSTGALSSIGWDGTQATGSPTVVDTTQNWASRGIFMLADATNPNQPPVASFTPSCSTTSTSCSFDASASHDPDGTITGYDWTFGSSTVEHHNDSTLFTHDFGTPGVYTVSLTVTDNDGAKTISTQQVTVGQTTPVPTFSGVTNACGAAAASCAASTSATVPVPSGTAPSDALLMFVTWPSAPTVTATVPAGWKLLGTNLSSPLETDVYYRAATGSDNGTTVPVTFSAATTKSVTLADYTGADPTTIEASAKIADASTAAHVTPNTTVTTAGSLALSYWADKSSTTTSWAPPASVKTRSSSFGTGGGYTSTLLADSGTTVGAGAYGGLTATSSPGTSGKGTQWTIVLAPAGAVAPNSPPTAAFTPSCSGLSCSFNAGASGDTDGTITSYAWTFGDGASQAGSLSTNATHVYSTAGPYTVTLTVTDNGHATGTKQIVVNPTSGSNPAAVIAFVGANQFDGSVTAANVAVPASASPGDALLLFESHASSTITASTPAGWTLVGTKVGSAFTSSVYEKTATAGDASSNVQVTFSALVKSSLTVADYTNTAGSPIETSASATSTGTSHATPAVSGLTTGSWAVSYWTDKSTTTSAWVLPAGVTQRAVILGSGGGAVSAALGDSAAAVTGAYPAKTATTNVSSGSGVQWSIALAPVA